MTRTGHGVGTFVRCVATPRIADARPGRRGEDTDRDRPARPPRPGPRRRPAVRGPHRGDARGGDRSRIRRETDVRDAADEPRAGRHPGDRAARRGTPPSCPRRPTVRRIVWSGEPLATTGSPTVPPADAGPVVGWRTVAGSHAEAGSGPESLDPGHPGADGPPAAWREALLADRLVRANRTELAWAAARGAWIVVSRSTTARRSWPRTASMRGSCRSAITRPWPFR